MEANDDEALRRHVDEVLRSHQGEWLMALDSFSARPARGPGRSRGAALRALQDVLFNPRLRVAYEVRDSIPVMLPDESRPVSDDEERSFNDDPQARLTVPSR